MLTSQTPFLQVEADGFTDMTDMDFMPETDTEALFDYCQGDLILPIESLQSSGVSVDGIGLLHKLLAANPTERPSAIGTLQHSWLAEVHLEKKPNTQSDPNPAWGAMSAARLPVTEDQCFNNLAMFIEEKNLRCCFSYNDYELRRLALKAKEMVEELFIRGCNEAVAMDLSILVLYDIVMLIGQFFTPPSTRKVDVSLGGWRAVTPTRDWSWPIWPRDSHRISGQT